MLPKASLILVLDSLFSARNFPVPCHREMRGKLLKPGPERVRFGCRCPEIEEFPCSFPC
jgi:hypothetical protein